VRAAAAVRACEQAKVGIRASAIPTLLGCAELIGQLAAAAPSGMPAADAPQRQNGNVVAPCHAQLAGQGSKRCIQRRCLPAAVVTFAR